MTLEYMDQVQKACDAFDEEVKEVIAIAMGGKVTEANLYALRESISHMVKHFFKDFPQVVDLDVELTFDIHEKQIYIEPMYKGKKIKTSLPKDTLGKVYQVVLLGIV